MQQHQLVYKALGDLVRERLRAKDMAALAADFAGSLECGNLEACGQMLGTAWALKRQQPGVTNAHIDAIVDRAHQHGALGCKLLGAGGAGFVLAWLKADHASSLRRAFPDARPVRPYHSGAHVVYQTEQPAPLPHLEALGRHAGGPL